MDMLYEKDQVKSPFLPLSIPFSTPHHDEITSFSACF